MKLTCGRATLVSVEVGTGGGQASRCEVEAIAAAAEEAVEATYCCIIWCTITTHDGNLMVVRVEWRAYNISGAQAIDGTHNIQFAEIDGI